MIGTHSIQIFTTHFVFPGFWVRILQELDRAWQRRFHQKNYQKVWKFPSDRFTLFHHLINFFIWKSNMFFLPRFERVFVSFFRLVIGFSCLKTPSVRSWSKPQIISRPNRRFVFVFFCKNRTSSFYVSRETQSIHQIRIRIRRKRVVFRFCFFWVPPGVILIENGDDKFRQWIWMAVSCIDV